MKRNVACAARWCSPEGGTGRRGAQGGGGERRPLNAEGGAGAPPSTRWAQRGVAEQRPLKLLVVLCIVGASKKAQRGVAEQRPLKRFQPGQPLLHLLKAQRG